MVHFKDTPFANAAMMRAIGFDLRTLFAIPHGLLNRPLHHGQLHFHDEQLQQIFPFVFGFGGGQPFEHGAAQHPVGRNRRRLSEYDLVITPNEERRYDVVSDEIENFLRYAFDDGEAEFDDIGVVRPTYYSAYEEDRKPFDRFGDEKARPSKDSEFRRRIVGTRSGGVVHD